MKKQREMLRLQSLKSYEFKKVDGVGFRVVTKNKSLKAHISSLGFSIYSKNDDYDKEEFQKLEKFCNLILSCHFS